MAKQKTPQVGDYFMTPEQFGTMQKTFQWLEAQIERSGTHEARWKMDTLSEILYTVDQYQQVKE